MIKSKEGAKLVKKNENCKLWDSGKLAELSIL